MFDDFLRRLKDRLFTPVALTIGDSVHPNVITVLAWLAGVLTAASVLKQAFAIALLFWFLNRGLDGLDGTLSRVARKQSDFGGYLDIVLDFSIYAMVLAALIIGSRSWQTAMAGTALICLFYVNSASWMYLAAILERKGRGAESTGELTTITMPPGIVAGTETFLFYVLFLVFPGNLNLLFTLMSIGVLATIVQRLVWARQFLRPHQ